MKVLIVDDMEENIFVMEALLEGAGHKVVSARNGKEALDQMQEGIFDLIISDIMMPVMDGFQLCRICKTNPDWREIPFIFYTATYTEKKDEEFALALGADLFVIKPQEPEKFLEIMKGAVAVPSHEADTIVKGSSPEEMAYLSMYSERLVRKLEKKVDDLARLNLALRESEEKYRIVVDYAAEAILIAQDDRIRFVNPGGVRLLGYSEDILTSKPFIEFIHPEDCGMVLESHRKRLRGENISHVYPFRIVSKDGTVSWVEINAVEICWKERPATLNFLTNITKRRQAEEELTRSLDNLRKALGGTVQAIAMIVEARDPYTAGHQKRVAHLARAIAGEMKLESGLVEGLRMAAMIHDIGKVSVPAEILSKPTRLSPIEFVLIQVHPQTGYDILKEIDFPWPIAQIVLQHHERMNGSGYPKGMEGGEILQESRIIAVADVIESMVSHRPYRPALGMTAALEEIEKNKGSLYDANVVDACLGLFREKGFQFVDA
jgi:PAS domain S-box-containing protein/putative nucleotidyltransferase with HDIG domain